MVVLHCSLRGWEYDTDARCPTGLPLSRPLSWEQDRENWLVILKADKRKEQRGEEDFVE